MADTDGFDWDEGIARLSAVSPGSPFAVVVEPGSWQIFRWGQMMNPSDAWVSLHAPGMRMPVTLPRTLSVPGFAAGSLQELADGVGVDLSVPVTGSRLLRPRLPRGIDGTRQRPGLRPAPVLDPGPGVLACSSCVSLGVVRTLCLCSSTGVLLHGACSLCRGAGAVMHSCDACGGVGSFLWPATVRVSRRDGLTGPSGGSETAIDVDLAACGVSIERSFTVTAGTPVWQDRWMVDVFSPFVIGCRELGIEWPDAVVWVGGQPTAASQVSTAFTLLRLATVSPLEPGLQPHVGKWLVREGPASPADVLSPELLGLHAASIVARLSRGAVDVSPMPSLEVLLEACQARATAAGLKLAVTCRGSELALVMLSELLEPQAVIAHGSSMADLLLHAHSALGC